MRVFVLALESEAFYLFIFIFLELR
ncbi:hypothetical protein OIU79_009481, partial [Salix purpurea]